MSAVIEQIEKQIAELTNKTVRTNTGVIASLADGVAKIDGLSDVMYNEMIAFPGDTMGIALNIEQDQVGCIVLGDVAHLKEGEEVRTTGRPRRVGGFDVPASRYGVAVQGATELALTKLDVLSYLDKIPVCVAYEVDGVRTEQFPSGDKLMRAKPVIEYVEGFKQDISDCRKQEDLPDAARNYVLFIEQAMGCTVKYVSVGAGRDDYLTMR